MVLCLLPALVMTWQLNTGQLGPDPAKYLMQGTGEWSLRVLMVVLLAAPLAQRGWQVVFRYRRLLGLTVFSYACLHLLLFAQVYVGWDPVILLEELSERPYIIVGFSAWLLLLPLALTSSDAARRYLGRRWRQLHRLVYPAAVLIWLHMVWLVRSDLGEAVVYAVAITGLLVWRVRRYEKRARRSLR